MKQATSCFVLVLLASLLSCTRGSEPERVYDFCRVTRVYSPGTDTGFSAMKLFYDNQDRLVLIDGATDERIDYLPGQIRMYYLSFDPGTYTVYLLNPDSTAHTSLNYNAGTRMDSTLYYYDAEGYLVKSVRFTQAFGKDSVLQSFANGNLSRITYYSSNGNISQANFEYTDQPAKSWWYQQFGPFNANGQYFPWLGKANRNLIRTVRSEFNGNPDPATMSYELNASGYVRTSTMSFLGTTDRKVWEYSCR